MRLILALVLGGALLMEPAQAEAVIMVPGTLTNCLESIAQEAIRSLTGPAAQAKLKGCGFD